jgi:hypothetical protein
VAYSIFDDLSVKATPRVWFARLLRRGTAVTAATPQP